MQKKTVAAIASGTVLALGLSGVGVNEALAKTVTVSIDGTPTEVRTYAGSVEKLLEKDGIQLGEHDVVAPALDTRLTEGAEVSVQFARPVTVTVDGQSREIWTTATSVDQVLAMLQVADDQAVLSTSRSAGIGREGLSFSVTTSKDVTVVVDGTATDLLVTANTVGDLLAAQGISVTDQHLVIPSLETPVMDGTTVWVTTPKTVSLVVDGKSHEVTTTVDTVRDLLELMSVGYGDSHTISPSLGTSLTDGMSVKVNKPAPKPTPAAADTTSAATSSSPSSSSAASTSAAAAPKTSAPAVASGSTWDQLAQCESGGNWAINTGNGYYGGLQFSLSTWQAFGGTGMPNQNSREQQIAIASKVQASQGWGAWPACSAKLGLR